MAATSPTQVAHQGFLAECEKDLGRLAQETIDLERRVRARPEGVRATFSDMMSDLDRLRSHAEAEQARARYATTDVERHTEDVASALRSLESAVALAAVSLDSEEDGDGKASHPEILRHEAVSAFRSGIGELTRAFTLAARVVIEQNRRG